MTLFNFSTLPPLSLYIHIPWCVRKCPYCDFNSHELREGLPEDQYIDALIADLESELPYVWGRSIQSIFIGGGTPSLFSAESIDRLLCAIRARLLYRPDMEITLEANPGAIEAARFKELRAAGINRLSIGVQSFDDGLLQRIGRIHNGLEAQKAIDTALAAGFENFNLDLMFGLPEQTESIARSDIQTAIESGASHLSFYQLTIEANTAFYAKPPQLPDDENIWTMQDQCHELLAAAGFEQYEVSAFSKPDKQCQHNLNYWHFGDYLGIGAGAHGKITDAFQQNITRRSKLRHPADYMQKVSSAAHVSEEHVLKRREVGLEFMMNALRLHGGFPVPLFNSHTGLPLTVVEKALKEAEERGLIEWDVHRIQPTERGRHFLNDLLGLFV